MGLDAVEFVMAIEDEFDLNIDDGELENVTTCRQMADFVCKKLNKEYTSKAPHCTSQFRFYKLRSALMKYFDISRQNIKPITPLHDIFKPEDLPLNWEWLSKRVGSYSFPRLKCGIGTWFFLSILTLAPLSVALIAPELLHFLIFVCLYLGVFLYATVTPLLANQMPSNYPDITSIIPHISLEGFSTAPEHDQQEILDRILKLAADNFGLDLEKIHPDANFFDDLGVDS